MAIPPVHKLISQIMRCRKRSKSHISVLREKESLFRLFV